MLNELVSLVVTEKKPAFRVRPIVVDAYSISGITILVIWTVAVFGFMLVWTRAFWHVAEVVSVEVAW